MLGSQPTRSVHLDLPPYHTQTAEYHFYFPLAGEFPHYPVHVARNEQLLAFAEPFQARVGALMDDPAELDRIMAEGAGRAREVAAQTLADVYGSLGLVAAR